MSEEEGRIDPPQRPEDRGLPRELKQGEMQSEEEKVRFLLSPATPITKYHPLSDYFKPYEKHGDQFVHKQGLVYFDFMRKEGMEVKTDPNNPRMLVKDNETGQVIYRKWMPTGKIRLEFDITKQQDPMKRKGLENLIREIAMRYDQEAAAKQDMHIPYEKPDVVMVVPTASDAPVTSVTASETGNVNEPPRKREMTLTS